VELMVEEMRWEARGVLSLGLVDPSGAELPAWEPGAHVDLAVGELVRQYSLCGTPGDRRRYRVAVLLTERSRGGSSHVHEELRPGDLVEVGGPRNHFELVETDRYLFIAGGIGITPLLPMIEAVERTGRSWRLVYGGRSLQSMAFVERLRQYGDRVVLVPADRDGLIDLAALLAVPTPEAVYACGPEPMLEVVESLCASWPEGALHVERFTPRSVDHDDDGSFEVVCQSTGASVLVAPGVSIVDALESVDVWLPTACREGICGTCETRVIEGTPDHRDSILTADERACGKTMMPCVSRCTSARLVLDL
jgi:ferredoxin-NADP reductase